MNVNISLTIETSSNDTAKVTAHLFKYLTFRNLEELLNREPNIMQIEVHSKKFTFPEVVLNKSSI